MIDNLPFYTEDDNSMHNAYNCGLLDFIETKEKIYTSTGELYYIKNLKYLNLFFSFRTNSIGKFQKLTIRGSIHTFYNNGKHNANILTFEDFKITLNKYSSLFGIDLTKCKLLPLENGTNLFLNDFSIYKVNDIIENTFCVKRKMFSHNAGIDTSLISGTSKTEVRIKFYSKSANFPELCCNTLRIEDKLTKIRGLNNKNIVSVSDLYNIKNHIILLEKHLDNMSKIVIYDYTIKMPKKSKFLNVSKELSNPVFWRKLIKRCKNKEEYDTKYNEKVNQLNNLSKKYGSNILQHLVQHSKKQSLRALGLCYFSEFKILKSPKNAPLIKLKNAQSYIGCNPCTFATTLL